MGFNTYSLNDVCLKITDGSHFSPPDDADSPIPMLSVKDMAEYDFKYDNCKHVSRSIFEQLKRTNCVPQKGDILVAKDGSYLKEIFVNKETTEKAVLSSIAIFRPNTEIVVPEFLCYLLKSPRVLRYAKDNCVSGSALPRIILKAFKGIKLEIPDLETQQKIVRILSALDQKIELNNKISDNLLRVAHQIYINDIKNLPTVKTEKLGSLCRIKYGKGLPTSKILKSGYRVYGGNGIIGFYNEKMYDKSQVLISCRGAASGKVIFTRPECFVTNNSLILECEDKKHYFVKEFSLDREYYDYTTGSAQPQITIDNIKDIELSVPDDETLIRFNATLRPLEEKYFTILEENEALAKTRDTLLPKLISGEINLDKVMTDE